MNVALAPAGNPAAREHYADTIVHRVEVARLEPHLDPSDLEKINTVATQGMSMVWGVTANKNLPKWEKIGPGTLCIFVRSGQMIHAAEVTFTTRNPDAARSIWGEDDQGRTWECMFFLDNLRSLDMPWASLRRVLGYNDGDRLMGFRVLNEDRSRRAIQFIDLPGELRTGTSPQEAAEAVQGEFEGEQTDAQILGTRRLEQGHLRQRLLGGKETAKCISCGRELPVNLLIAAHIKRRSACTMEERLDFENIAAPMCLLGCDALFERGLIYATHQGWHLAETLPASVKDQVVLTEGREFITDDNKKYFEWHRKQVAENR